nr:MAG TPA: hypothetical protein [Caudoviricetes sp.]
MQKNPHLIDGDVLGKIQLPTEKSGQRVIPEIW